MEKTVVRGVRKCRRRVRYVREDAVLIEGKCGDSAAKATWFALAV
jgi:hypothetical protein